MRRTGARDRWVRFLSAVEAATARKFLMALDSEMVAQIFTSWNQVTGWLRQLDGLRAEA
jgi:hypothetical protein